MTRYGLGMVWLGVVAVAALHGNEAGWTEITAKSGRGGAHAKHAYAEFTLDEPTPARIRWTVEVVSDGNRKPKPYFRLKMERWAERNRKGAWQNVGPICTVHYNDAASKEMTFPPGRYRLVIYYQDVSYETAVERKT